MNDIYPTIKQGLRSSSQHTLMKAIVNTPYYHQQSRFINQNVTSTSVCVYRFIAAIGSVLVRSGQYNSGKSQERSSYLENIYQIHSQSIPITRSLNSMCNGTRKAKPIVDSEEKELHYDNDNKKKQVFIQIIRSGYAQIVKGKIIQYTVRPIFISPTSQSISKPT